MSKKKIVVFSILGLVIIPMIPLLIMVIIRISLEVGFWINQISNISIMTIDISGKSTLGEYYYFYTQILSVVLTALFTLALVYFAFKDYYDKNIKKFDLDFRISDIIELIIEYNQVFIHLPISFINKSKRLGFIDNIELMIFDSNFNKITKLKPTHFVFQNLDYSVNISNDYKSGYFKMRPKRYEDGLPFVGIPINPEQSIREYVTFKEIENMCDVNIFDFSNIYYFAIKYENANNESNRVRNLYEFKLNYANSIHRDVLDRAKKLFLLDCKRNIKTIKSDEKERLDNEFNNYLSRTNRIEVEVKLISDVEKLKNCDCKF